MTPCELGISLEHLVLIRSLLEHGGNEPNRDSGAFEDRFALQPG
jgi:hypothetical protein